MQENTDHTALLVMDMQAGILRNYPDNAAIANAARAIAIAREKKIPVIFVVVGFRQGMPEIGRRNKSFSSGMRERFAGQNMEEWMKVHPNLAPHPDDIIVTKRRVSAFTGSDLEVVLRAHDIHHLVLAGVATSGVVLSTLREAADKDYQLTVLSDCCIDADPEVHRVLTTKVFPRQADIMSTEEWRKHLE